MKNYFKRIIGYWMLIEAVAAIGIFIYTEELRKQFIPALITIALFLFLAYLCLKKTKHNNETPSENNKCQPNNSSSDGYINTRNICQSNNL